MNKRNAESDNRALYIPKAIFDEICLHAREEAPLEACGYLAGTGNRIKKLYRMRNADASEEHFSFYPEEQLATIKKAREERLEMIGAYHSHPYSPPRPSAEDIRLAYDPELIHLILSLLAPKPTLKAFLVKDGKPLEITVTII